MRTQDGDPAEEDEEENDEEGGDAYYTDHGNKNTLSPSVKTTNVYS